MIMRKYTYSIDRKAGSFQAVLRGVCILIALVCTLASCSRQGNNTRIIRVAFNQNENHPQYIAMKTLGEMFSEATDGRYTMQIYPNGVLGEQGSMAEFVRTGALEMAIGPFTVPEAYDPNFAIVGAPYLYQDMDHMRRALDAGVYKELFQSTRKYGFEVLTIYTAGERSIYAKKPVNTPEDLRGMIIRTNDGPTPLAMAKAMGGIGAVMSQADVYTALQQGVIDAAENSERVYMDFKHYEVTPYYSYTKHIVHPDVVFASTQFLDSLSSEDRAVFDRLVLESADFEFAAFKESVIEAKADAEAQGAQFNYPDIEPFRERCMPLLEQVANKSAITKRIFDSIEALREEEE